MEYRLIYFLLYKIFFLTSSSSKQKGEHLPQEQGHYWNHKSASPFLLSQLYLVKLYPGQLGSLSRGCRSQHFCCTSVAAALLLWAGGTWAQCRVCFTGMYRDLHWHAALGCHSSRQQVWVETIRKIGYPNEIIVWLMDWQGLPWFLPSLVRELCFML